MTISIYLIRLITSFFFGASLLCLGLERYFAYSGEWDLENNPLRIVMIVVIVIILVLSGICLWTIR